MTMTTLYKLRDAIEKKRFGVVRRLLQTFKPNDIHALKHAQATSAWRRKYFAERGRFSNVHYEAVYTRLFGLDKQFYAGKRVLDIGCGPRGSLEWADGALETVGADPLVPAYRRLGIDRHRMRYVATGVENLPFADGYFDIVASINSLDHVDDVDRGMSEILRVTKPGGSILLWVEIDHPPRVTEPASMTVDQILAAFAGCTVAHLKIYAIKPGEFSNDAESLLSKPERPPGSRDLGGLVAHFVRS